MNLFFCINNYVYALMCGRWRVDMDNNKRKKDLNIARAPITEFGEFVSWFDRWIQPIDEKKKANKAKENDFYN